MNSSFDPTVQTIVGKSVDEIKAELFKIHGENYEIRGIQPSLTPGFMGFFQKSCVKVLYIVKQRNVVNTKEDFNTSKDEILKKVGLENIAVKQNAQMLNMMQELSCQISELKSASNTTEKHLTIQKIEELLLNNEFTHSFVNNITSKIRASFPLEELEDFDKVQTQVVDWIGDSIKITPKIIRKLPHVIVLIGPTGVGKTTTISKIAANLILEAKRKNATIPSIRFITIDRTRVGAEEQLRKFGELMGIPVDKAETTEDVKQIFEQYKNSVDYILIDTSGYSPYDYENIGKMRALLDVPGLRPDVYLTFSAEKKARDLEKIILNYESFNFDSVIITKCDETTCYGNVLSVLAEKNKSIAYITDGQKVPRDIKRATVVNFLKNLEGFDINRFHIDERFPEDN